MTPTIPIAGVPGRFLRSARADHRIVPQTDMRRNSFRFDVPLKLTAETDFYGSEAEFIFDEYPFIYRHTHPVDLLDSVHGDLGISKFRGMNKEGERISLECRTVWFRTFDTHTELCRCRVEWKFGKPENP